MFEFIDALISFSESHPEVTVSFTIEEGETGDVFIYHNRFKLGIDISTIQDLDSLDWSKVAHDQLAESKAQTEDLEAVIKRIEKEV